MAASVEKNYSILLWSYYRTNSYCDKVNIIEIICLTIRNKCHLLLKKIYNDKYHLLISMMNVLIHRRGCKMKLHA